MVDGRRKTYLREWREYSGLSLQAVAAEAGNITQPTLSRIERGLVPYNQDLLERLAVIYGCEPAELLMQDPFDDSKVVSIWEHADEGQRKAIAAVAESIVGFTHNKSA